MFINSLNIEPFMDVAESIKGKYLGVAICLILSIPAWFLGKQLPIIGGPVFAILMGMVVAIILKGRYSDKLSPGINFTSKYILQAAVVFLGFGLNLSVILATGVQSLPVIFSTISVSLIVSYVLYRAMHMDSKISTLIGVGSSICGGSAIAATAPVIKANDSEIAQSISVIFLFNVIAALIFPTLGMMLGLSDEGFALFAGTAINDTSSVTAAASAWDGIHGSNTLDSATIVKLTRTLMIIPIVLVLAFIVLRKEKNETGSSVNLKKVFPFFVLFFVLASVITTVAVSAGVPSEAFAPLKELSKLLIIMAMAAIGLNTDIVKLVRSGGKPIFMGLCCWIAIAISSLLMQNVLGYW